MSALNVLIACEFSQRVAKAIESQYHDYLTVDYENIE